jgi:polyferredoxin
MTFIGNTVITDKYDLFRYKYAANFWRSKYYPLVFQVCLAAIMVGMVYDGFFGSSSYTENAITMGAFFAFWWGIIFVMGVMGRSWCAVCPVGAISGAVNKFNRGFNFPKRLSNWALPAASYAILLWGLQLVFDWRATPQSTIIWFVGILALAVGMGLLFKGRSFCKYMCPITAPLAVMARLSPIEVRARTQGSTYTEIYIKNIPMLKSNVVYTSENESRKNDVKNTSKDFKNNKNVRMIDPECKECKTHDCANGNEETEGCPWGQHPSVMMENNACSMCMKCTHSCPSGQPMRLRLRNPLSEISNVFRPNAGEIAIILVLLSYYSIYGWYTLPNILFPDFSTSFIDGLSATIPFLTHDNIEYYLVGTFMTIGFALGLYSVASYGSAKISKTRFRLNFNNYGYAYLLIFILPLPLSVTIGYVPYYGEFANLALNHMGINMNLSDGFVFQDFIIYKNSDYDIKFTEILYSFPVLFAIPIGIYLVTRISNNILKKQTTRINILKTGSPHMVLLTLFTLLAFYSSVQNVINY